MTTEHDSAARARRLEDHPAQRRRGAGRLIWAAPALILALAAILPCFAAAPAFAQADPFAWFEQLFKPPAPSRVVKPKTEFHRAAPRRDGERARTHNRTSERAPARTSERPAKHAAEKPAEKSSVAPTYFVAVLGDSLGAMLGQGLSEAFADRPDVAILHKAKENSGLVRDDFFDWTKATQDLLASGEKIDFAVMMIGSNDRQTLRDPAGAFEPRSPEWEEAYARRIEAIVAQFRDRKIPLVWVGLPVFKSERLSDDAVAFNEFYREHAAKAGAIYVDVWEAFADELERYSAFGPDLNGETVRLRTADGVHFTKAGARKLAHFVEPEIRSRLEAIAPPSPEGGAPASGEAEPAPVIEAPSGAPAEAALAPAEEPAPPPPRPVAGPVLPLTGPVLAPRGELATRVSASKQPSLRRGAPSEPKPGRADDFAWPRP